MIKQKIIFLLFVIMFIFIKQVSAQGDILIPDDPIEIIDGGNYSFDISFDNTAGKIGIEIIDKEIATLSVSGYDEEKDNTYYADNGVLTVNIESLKPGDTLIRVDIIDVSSYDEEEIIKDPVLIDLKVIAKEITNVDIEKLPNTLKYKQNDTQLDLTGGVLKITYNDNTINMIDMNGEDIKVIEFDTKNLGDNYVKLQYGEKDISYEIKIVENDISSPKTGISENYKYLFMILALLMSAIYIVIRKKSKFLSK